MHYTVTRHPEILYPHLQFGFSNSIINIALLMSRGSVSDRPMIFNQNIKRFTTLYGCTAGKVATCSAYKVKDPNSVISGFFRPIVPDCDTKLYLHTKYNKDHGMPRMLTTYEIRPYRNNRNV